MFHLLANGGDLGAAAANVTVPNLTDDVFIARNNGYIFTEQWASAGLFAQGATITRVRSNVPKLNAFNRHHIFPLNQSATIPSNPQMQDMRKEPLAYPMNEVFLWEGSNGAAGAEQCRVLSWLVGPDWTTEFPEHLQRLTVRATGAAVGTANDWGLLSAITFADQDLRGGVYSIIGCQCFDAGSIAFRFRFPRQRDVNGRKLRPGGMCMEAVGNIPHPIMSGGLGEWGRFHTFEPPTIQILANAAGASAQELRLDLLYLGEDISLVEQAM